MPFYEQEQRSRPITVHLIIINVIVYLATKINPEFMVSKFGLFYPTSPFFNFWQPLTYMFMHGNFMHIFFNMWSLYIFGKAVEQIIGEKRFLTLFIVCGLGAAAVHLAVQYAQVSLWMDKIADGARDAAAKYVELKRTPTVGASGSVYGILVAFAMIFPEARLTLIFPPVTLSAKWMAVIFIGLELLTGITGTADGVAHFAHLGGALVGWLLIWWWYKRPKRNKYESFHY